MTGMKRKPRKPKCFNVDGWSSHADIDMEYDPPLVEICTSAYQMDAKKCRKLAAWLTKAAEYLESKEANK